MNVKERLQALVAGKKIRRVSWAPGDYIRLSGDQVIWDQGIRTHFGLQNLGGSDQKWELFKEPVRHTVWVNLYPDGDGLAYRTKAEADRRAGAHRLECREITWEVPPELEIPDNG